MFRECLKSSMFAVNHKNKKTMKNLKKGLLATLIMLMFFSYSAKAGEPVGAPAPTDPHPIESLGNALVEDAKLIWHWIVG